MGSNKPKVYERDGIKITAYQVAEQAGINISTAHNRLRRWIKGILKYEYLFEPANAHRSRTEVIKEEIIPPDNEELELLRRIPGPTECEIKYEKELSGPVQDRY